MRSDSPLIGPPPAGRGQCTALAVVVLCVPLLALGLGALLHFWARRAWRQ